MLSEVKGSAAPLAIEKATTATNGKDAGGAATTPQFGDVLNQIQAKYGAKGEKPREIKKNLGKDDFLRIMITQMKHQDPTKPFEADKMGSELAQFTSVEQLQNLNQAMTKLMTNNQPIERMAMTNMIGKTITVDRERFPHTEGSSDSLSYVLPQNASKVRVAILDQGGEEVFQKDLGPVNKGEQSFFWDGLKSNTLPSKSGTYLFRIEAENDKGQSLPITRDGTVKVVGVSFEGTEPVFLVGNAARPDKVTMRNVVRIVDSPMGALVPGAQSLAGAVASGQSSQPAAPQFPTLSGSENPQNQISAQQGQGDHPAAQAHAAANPPTAAQGRNFFNFSKGSGSESIDQSRLTPEVRQALEQYALQAQEATQDRESAPEERGFPNGLSDSEKN